jgi:glycosyltransferase involved in cell wall biosynthesis
LNILFINSSRVWGGNEKWTLRAAETLAERGHAVTMAVRDLDLWTGHARRELERIVLPFLNDADLRTVFGLHRLIVRRNVEIIVPTRSRDYWLSGFARMGTHARYVMRMGITRELPHTLKEHLRYRVFPDGIVVNAEAVRQSLARHPWIRAERIRVIYNGVDVPASREALPPLKRAGEFLIIAAGRLGSDKGFDVLIEALTLAVKDVPNLRAVIFGRGEMEKALHHLISLRGLEHRVSLGGFTNALASALAQADLAVSASYREGISNFILESWSAGVPVIATAIPGSAEIVSDGVRGKLVPPGDPVRMAQAILQAYHHPELRAIWSRAGREAISTTFNWNRMAEQLEAFFEELITEKPLNRF